ncbi:putative transcription factor C2H2 family [Medicago truncatula]|uniref:Putative transcription factor C2H2 family n=1 Tax=Medicago truncatula TaxID=3880 RepID=A0A072UT04_MEDTR|nr:UBP1-associated proteins 1C [Medicago truncatula]KEH32471.1 zinc ion-binding protein [Medicago truncatula]RHN64600.1 putative transcription factor C2H2 family [Medicago truncatula]
MVWFQCEDCGDNLKKPKLPNHFRSCPANKLSCIDCGQMFGRDTVQNHTQCITEAEKYGPKGQGKTLNAAASKPIKDGKQRPVVDINVGLSERPPWFCSLCNTKATSKQALLLHAEGKKHGAKARMFHASKQPPVQTDNSAPDAKDAVETASNGMSKDDKIAEQPKLHESSEQNNLKPGNEVSSEKKKRKREALEGDVIKKSKNDTSVDAENGEVIQGEKARERKIKWKKFIKAALKSHPDGLKMKKLRKVVFKALKESSIVVNENELSEAIEQKINSSSNFAVENKHVRLVVKD